MENIDPVRVGTAAVVISLLVNFGMGFMKSPALKEVLKKIPVKARAFVAAGLSTVLSVAASWLTGLSLEEAIAAGMSGFFMAVTNYKVVVEDWMGRKTGEAVQDGTQIHKS